MTRVVCRRCKSSVPKSSTRQSKVWGGRICPTCYNYMGELMRNRGIRGTPPPKPPTIVPQHEKRGLLTRIANRLFRRRGIQ